jgi:hypothetical protein
MVGLKHYGKGIYARDDVSKLKRKIRQFRAAQAHSVDLDLALAIEADIALLESDYWKVQRRPTCSKRSRQRDVLPEPCPSPRNGSTRRPAARESSLRACASRMRTGRPCQGGRHST